MSRDSKGQGLFLSVKSRDGNICFEGGVPLKVLVRTVVVLFLFWQIFIVRSMDAKTADVMQFVQFILKII